MQQEKDLFTVKNSFIIVFKLRPEISGSELFYAEFFLKKVKTTRITTANTAVHLRELNVKASENNIGSLSGKEWIIDRKLRFSAKSIKTANNGMYIQKTPLSVRSFIRLNDRPIRVYIKTIYTNG